MYKSIALFALVAFACFTAASAEPTNEKRKGNVDDAMEMLFKGLERAKNDIDNKGYIQDHSDSGNALELLGAGLIRAQEDLELTGKIQDHSGDKPGNPYMPMRTRRSKETISFQEFFRLFKEAFFPPKKNVTGQKNKA